MYKLFLLGFLLVPMMAQAGNITKHIGNPPVEEKMIMEMKPGEVGYTVPWAVKNDDINPKYSIFPKPGGTVQLKVKCVGPGKYEVDWTGVK